jgi:hypothetical protein
MIADTLTTVDWLRTATTTTEGAPAPAKPLLRADSACFGYPTIGAALRGGADVSITTGLNSVIWAAIATIAGTAWTPIRYTNALYDDATQRWISVAEVAEIPFTAFASQKKAHHIPGRRIPDLRPTQDQGQRELFDVWRFHAFFATTDPDEIGTVDADQMHRRHAIIEQVHADLKSSALAHMPSGHLCANAAWLVCAVMAFNLTRAAATLAGDGSLAKATTATIRRTLIAVPTRIVYSARKLTLHLPQHWPWQKPWTTLFESMFGQGAHILAQPTTPRPPTRRKT